MGKYLKLAIVLLSAPNFLLAQYAEALIYGEITLNNGELYTGQIRWEDDQSLWGDIFRADKNERPAHNLLSEKELREIDNRSDNFQFGFMALWEDKRPETNFLFQCSFGDIESLKTTGKNKEFDEMNKEFETHKKSSREKYEKLVVNHHNEIMKLKRS